MASLISKGERRYLQFQIRPNAKKQTIALGIMAEEEAQFFRKKVTLLVEAVRSSSPPDVSTAAWVRKLSDDHHRKLAQAGLVVSRISEETAVPKLAAFLDAYIAKREAVNPKTKRAGVKKGTATIYRQVRDNLVEKIGATRALDRITVGEAEDWREWLSSEKGLGPNTIRRRCGVAKQFFRVAVKHRMIAESPFADMGDCLVQGNPDRDHYIDRDTAKKVLDACPDAQWRLLFALSRYGGLRCPSEHLALTWADVDWEHSRLTVHSPKTERKGKPWRLLPIFPELRPYLEEVWEQTEPGTQHVITRYRDTNANLRTQLLRIIARAGVAPWPKLFQNLRATRATELVAAGWPEYKVCAWIGHTEAVAKKHYWQVTDDDYRKAAGQQPEEGISALQLALQIPAAKPCNAVQDDFGPNVTTPAVASPCINSHRNAGYCKNDQARLTGFEPVTYGLGNRCSIP